MEKFTKPKLYSYNFDLKKVWFVAFRFHDNETGIVKQFQYRGDINKFSSKKERIEEANALTAVLQEMLESGWNPILNKKEEDNKPTTTLIDTLEYLIEIRRNTIKPESTRTYNDVVKVFTGYLNKIGLNKIHPFQFSNLNARSYLDWTLKKGYGATTHNKHLSMLITLFNLMVDRQYLKVNPFVGIKSLRRDVGKNIAFSESEKYLLANELKRSDNELLLFVQFMYYCFLRRTEIYRLKIKDVNIEDRTVLVAFGSGKNRKQEGVSIPASFVNELKKLDLKQYDQDWFMFSRNLKRGSEFMKKADRVSDKHRKYLKTLNFGKDKTIYSWKHTGVVDLYQEIKDPYAIMRQLRHYDLQTTMIYLKSLGLQANQPVLDSKISMF